MMNATRYILVLCTLKNHGGGVGYDGSTRSTAVSAGGLWSSSGLCCFGVEAKPGV